ncbi:hypothetical protein Vau01_123100 [Virgisporangium aurantiacum]|uniref:Uncharacterized protein n=1 Tax=Virgisporangium aurantiacum TaxID=175570 RepID=A0A8J4E7Y2_9ACTN|nr:hypothetical protein Vau01_123100 [Virgisporangium aurantiacum]
MTGSPRRRIRVAPARVGRGAHHNELANGLSDNRIRRLKAATDAAALDAGHIPTDPPRHLANAV